MFVELQWVVAHTHNCAGDAEIGLLFSGCVGPFWVSNSGTPIQVRCSIIESHYGPKTNFFM